MSVGGAAFSPTGVPGTGGGGPRGLSLNYREPDTLPGTTSCRRCRHQGIQPVTSISRSMSGPCLRVYRRSTGPCWCSPIWSDSKSPRRQPCQRCRSGTVTSLLARATVLPKGMASMSVPTGQPGTLSEVDPVRRLKVLSAAVPSVVVVERIIPLPFETVWSVACDLEHELRRRGGSIRLFQIVRAEGDWFEVLVRGRAGLHDRFAGELRSDRCWMQGRRIVAVMTAVPVAEGALIAVAALLLRPGAVLLRSLKPRSVVTVRSCLERRSWGVSRKGDAWPVVEFKHQRPVITMLATPVRHQSATP